MLSQLVEAVLQREISQRPGEYKRCEAVALGFTRAAAPLEGAPAPPAVSVEFR